MFFAGPARLVLARGLMDRGSKAGVAAPAAPSAGNHKFLIGAGELECLLASFVVVDDGADGNFQQHVAAVASGFVGAFAVPSALSFVLGIESEVHQRVVPLAGLHDDVAAFAAIAARRSPTRDKLLPPEGHAAVSAVASFDFDFGFVDEHGSQLAVPSTQL